MISNPHLLEPTAAAAWAEGFTKGFLAISSPEPGENVSQDDLGAFNEGVEAGANAAANGLDTGISCVPAREGDNPAEPAIMVWDGLDIAHGVWESVKLAKAGFAISSIVVSALVLAVMLPVHTLPPDQVLPDLGQQVIDVLASYGLDSMELFCGAGLDPTAEGCEIKLTPLFSSQDQAREAAQAMGRSEWIVARWRTDQSNSFRIVESS